MCNMKAWKGIVSDNISCKLQRHLSNHNKIVKIFFAKSKTFLCWVVSKKSNFLWRQFLFSVVPQNIKVWYYQTKPFLMLYCKLQLIRLILWIFWLTVFHFMYRLLQVSQLILPYHEFELIVLQTLKCFSSSYW